MSQSDFVSPRYADRSLSDVLPAVAAALGVPLGEEPVGLELPDAPSYVVFLIDGLGAQLLDRHAGSAPYLSSLLAGSEPGTAGVPSTTGTSLTSLGTGLPPGTHGVVGFTSRIPGTQKLLNALSWDKEVDPRAWQPHPTTFEELSASGVRVTVVNKKEFRGSGLTVAAHRGGSYVPADRVGARIAAGVSAATAAPSVTYLYEADLDWTGHRYGVDSAAWRHQLRSIDDQAQQLRESLPSHTRLLVIADHGMVDSPPAARIDIDVTTELRDGLALLGGEARFRHLYARTGAVSDLAATWACVLGAAAQVLTRDEAIERGWFGTVTDEVRPRLGDVVAACTGDSAILSTTDFGYEATLVGMHGSLTPVEMLIPILVD